MSYLEEINQLKNALEEIDDPIKQAITYCEIGELYYENQEFDEAKNNYEECVKICESKSERIFDASYKLGLIYLFGDGSTNPDLNKAIEHFEESIQDMPKAKLLEDEVRQVVEKLTELVKTKAVDLKQEQLKKLTESPTPAQRRALKPLQETLDDDYLAIITLLENQNIFSSALLVLAALNYKAKNYNHSLSLLKTYEKSGVSSAYHYYYGLNRYALPQNTPNKRMWLKHHLEQSQAYFPHASYLLGKIYLKSEALKKAVQYFEKARRGGYHKANYRLGLIYFNGSGTNQPDYAKAEEYLLAARTHLSKAQTLQDVCLKLSEIYEIKDDHEQYLAFLEEAREHGSEEALNKLIQYYTRSGEVEKAEEYSSALNRLKLLKDPLQYGKTCFNEKRYREANDIFINIVENQEQHLPEITSSAKYYLGLMFMHGHPPCPKEISQAIIYFNASQDEERIRPLISCYMKQKQYSKALSLLSDPLHNRRYVQENTAQFEYYKGWIFQSRFFDKAAQDRKKNDLTQAILFYSNSAYKNNLSAYKKLIELKKLEIDKLARADIYYHLGKIAINPTLASSYIKKHPQLSEKLTQDKAKKYFTKAAQSNHPKAEYELGKMALNNGNTEEAIEWFEKAAAKRHALAIFELGQISHKHNKWLDAINYYKLALSSTKLDSTKDIITQNLALLTNQLITKLLYKAKRHAWESPPCTEIRELLCKIDPVYVDKSQQELNQLLEAKETNSHDFFGLDLSDDSDSDEEESFKKCSVTIRESTHFYSANLLNKAGHIQAKKKLAEIGSNKPFAVDKEILDSNKVQIPATPMPKASILEDLKELNHWHRQGDLATGLKRIKTKFLVAGFRGITYKTTDWNAEQRRAHRKLDEIDKPIFSAAAYHAANHTFQEAPDDNQIQSIQEKAEEIRNTMLKLRETGPQPVTFSHEGEETEYLFDNTLYALQDQYTKGYDKFFEKLKELVEKRTIGLPNASNPFVSCGDIPLHALKYAYGIKPYKGHEHERLRPRWNGEGKAERPYSGKVYLTLHPVEDFAKNGSANHVVSLNNLGKVHIDGPKGEMIIQERETSHFGYVSEGRVKHTHVAKYPSFKGAYKEIYEAKYGIDKELYEMFQHAFQTCPPHSLANKRVKILLGEYLCNYHQIRLVERARQLALEQGATLVYLDQYGDFSLDLPPCNAPTTGQARDNLRDTRESNLRVPPSDFEDKEEEEDLQIEKKNEPTIGRKRPRKALHGQNPQLMHGKHPSGINTRDLLEEEKEDDELNDNAQEEPVRKKQKTC